MEQLLRNEKDYQVLSTKTRKTIFIVIHSQTVTVKKNTNVLHGYTSKHNRHERMQLLSERENIDCFNAKETKFNGI